MYDILQIHLLKNVQTKKTIWATPLSSKVTYIGSTNEMVQGRTPLRLEQTFYTLQNNFFPSKQKLNSFID